MNDTPSVALGRALIYSQREEQRQARRAVGGPLRVRQRSVAVRGRLG